MLSLLLALCISSGVVASFPLTVTLPDHGFYTGRLVNRTDLPQTVNAWLGIEYVVQPVGEHRFAPAIPLPQGVGRHNATVYGKQCLQNPSSSDEEEGEDCLTLNIYRPASADPKAKLPVAFYIHGGSFNTGAGKNIDGAAFVAKSKAPIMMVTINYRLGALGFLPSSPFAELDLLNLGFTDQTAALNFVHDNIEHFGGDKDQVTIMGLSAGAHSVGYHYLSQPQSDKPLFARATMHSGGPMSRGYPLWNYTLYQQQYSKFMKLVGCEEDQSAEVVMDCLKTQDAAVLRNASYTLFMAPASQWTITWPFQPVTGGPIIPVPGHVLWERDTANQTLTPIITGFCSNEGTAFVPRNLSTNAQFTAFFSNMLPALTPAHLAQIQSLYPDPATNASSPYANSLVSTQYSRTVAAYGDYAYICSVQDNAVRTTAAGVQGVWKYHFAQNNSYPASSGIPHTCDQVYQWDATGQQGPEVGSVYHSWLASFVATGDPNKIKGNDTAPEWAQYGGGKGQVGQQMYVEEGKLHLEEDTIRSEACEFWRSIPGELYH